LGFLLSHIIFIAIGDFSRSANSSHLSMLQPDRSLAEFTDVVHTVRAKQHTFPLLEESLHSAYAFFLKRLIANSQHFVSNEHVRVDAGRDRKA
jgi:hypothetical protein